MNSKSFDIQSIYAMKNVYFICFWSEAAQNIFVYKIILRKQINANGERLQQQEEKIHENGKNNEQQFSVQKNAAQRPLLFARGRREANFIQEEFSQQKQSRKRR